jgi:tetratricopeptide (TPR) repeat protein
MSFNTNKIRRSSRFLSALLLISAACLALLCACAAAQDSPLDTAEEQLKQGKYAEAIAGFSKLLTASDAEEKERAQHGLLRAYLETGKYAEAETEAKKFSAARAADPALPLLLGEVYAATGRYAEAIAAFEKAAKLATKKDDKKDDEDEQAGVRLRAELRRGEILLTTGKVEAAQEVFLSLEKYAEDNNLQSAEEEAAIAAALAHLEKYQDANDAYLEAIASDEEYLEGQLGGGELYTSKYNYEEAAKFFADALKVNPNSARAHLGVARNKEIEGGEEMRAALARALEINPNYVEAKTFSAKLDIEAERHDKATETLNQALKINPNSLEAHSLRAAMFWLQDRPAELENEIKTVTAINPRYGELYETLAHFASNTRRYREGVEFLRKAIELSPRLWSAHLALGQGLLRLGQMKEGREAVEVSFKGDAFNLWAKNTLDLLDSMAEYREASRPPFIIKAAPKESDVLHNYAGELLEEVHSKLTQKYKFTPQSPIAVEIFPNHEDFAVRTLGLPGLGALGVCFGQVIAQDSPSARPSGQFNWGSTLWHEYAHVITLQITDHRIPRWFSEGLSVFEEHNARPGWGDDWEVQHMKAISDGRWWKIADLDNGFIRPKRQDDVGLAYFQASQICHFVTDKYGFDAILGMLRGYKEKKKTPEILQQVLKLSESDFDRAFNEYVQGKVGRYIKTVEASFKIAAPGQTPKEEVLKQAAAQPDNFLLQIRAGSIYNSEGNVDKAVTHLKRALELFPYQSGDGNAYEQLAQIYEKRGDKAAQAEMLEALVKIDENDYEALKKLAKLKLEAGDKARALELLRLSFFVNPFEAGQHTLAGDLHLEKNENERAVREFQIALAANPPNIAEAQFNLARAYLATGQNKEAKRAVLRSLEIAPSFDKAQDLLLKLANP